MGSSQHASRCRDGAWRATRRSAANGPKVRRNPPHFKATRLLRPWEGRWGRPLRRSARMEALVAHQRRVDGGYSASWAVGDGRLLASSASANTKWCLGPDGACGSAMRCVPETLDGSCCRWRPIMLMSVAATAARSAAEPWKVGTEHPLVGISSSPSAASCHSGW